MVGRLFSGGVVPGIAALFSLLALCACGTTHSGAGSSNPQNQLAAQPSWAKSLGPGVTVESPAAAKPGNGSPGAVTVGMINALTTGKMKMICRYYQPSLRADCRTFAAGMPTMPREDRPEVKDFKLGYVAIKGNRALVGATGMFCEADQHPKCQPNNDPAAVFSSGKSFSADWAAAMASDDTSHKFSYALAPCVRVGGRWYVFSDQKAGL